MKQRALFLCVVLIAITSFWLLLQKENSHASKNNSQQSVVHISSKHQSGNPLVSLIPAALNNTLQQKFSALPFPAAPLDSLSEKEALDFPGARVVEFAEVAGPAPHQKLRLRILETHLKNPYLRTEEIVDASSGNLLGRLEMVADQLLVTLPPELTPQQFLNDFGPQALFITPVNESLSIYQLTLSDASLASLPGALAQMNSGAFTGAAGEPNYIAHLSAEPTNFGYGYQWALWKNKDSQYGDFQNKYEDFCYQWYHGETDLFQKSDVPAAPRFSSASDNVPVDNNFTTTRGINAEEGWNVRTDASSVIVGIIDTGIHATHENLKNNLWHLAENSNVHGYNAAEKNNDINDEIGHGTHCAGIIGGEANALLGVAGVAWKVQLMACKCADQHGNMFETDIINAIEYAKQHGASILNFSLGWTGADPSMAMALEIESLREHGIILVAAAGNDGVDNDSSPICLYPASYAPLFDNVVSVAATSCVENNADPTKPPLDREGLAFFSNYGATTVSLAAPGDFILSTFNLSDTSYAFLSGTSMAAPCVTGALALMKAEFPNASPQELIQDLIKTTDSLPSLDGKMIGGRLNLARALHTKPTPVAASPRMPLPERPAPSTENQSWKLLRGPCKRNDSISQQQ